MNRVIALTVAVVPLLFSCASNAPYRPASKPEKMEFSQDLLDIYPSDVRRSPDLYTNVAVGWVGIITKTQAKQDKDGLIHAVTTFEHHYFDWQEDRSFRSVDLNVAPRGEGSFKTEWELRPTSDDANAATAENYASPGTLAIVYGVPQAVEDGTVILKYRYLRVIDADHYSTNRFNYGRFGEPIHYIENSSASPQ